MKTTNLFIAILLSLYIMGCTETVSSVSPEEASQNSHEKVQLAINGSNAPFDVWHGASPDIPDQNYRLVINSYRYSTSNLKKIGESLGLPTPGNRLIGYVIYSNAFYKSKQSIDSETIYGVLVHYTNDNNKLYSSYYHIDNGKVIQVKGLNNYTKDISFDDMYDVFMLFGNNQQTSAIVMFNESIATEKALFSKKYSKTLRKYAEKEKKSNLLTEISTARSCGYCKFPCRPSAGNRCVPQEKPGSYERWFCFCMPDNCGWERVSEKLTEHSRIVPEDNGLYTLRDDFLMYSTKGRQYVSDYGLISEELDELITLEDAIIIASMVSTHSSKATYLTDRSYDSYILYDEDFKNKAVDLINSLIGRYVGFGEFSTSILDYDISVVDALIRVRTDIENYVNKPVSYIRADFQ